MVLNLTRDFYFCLHITSFFMPRFSIFCADPQSPLHLATYLDLTDVVKSLVEKGASLELQDQDGNTALHVACQHGQTKCATEMTREVSPSKLAPVLETQNWRGGIKRLTAARLHQPAIHCFYLGAFLCVCVICVIICLWFS